MAHPAVDDFGELLMRRVRDKAISHWEMIVSGRVKGANAQALHLLVSSWPADQRKAFLETLVPHVVDTTLHHLLWAVEENERVRLSIDDGPQLREVSDGLMGDLIDWRKKYSQYGDVGYPVTGLPKGSA